MNQDSLSAQIFLTVNTLEDQNDGSEIDGLSLRDAIIRANADSRKQYTINVPSGTYDLTLTGDGSLDINSNITIIGASASNTIISASFLGDRIFTVSGTGNFSLANITLQDANVGTENSIIDNTTEVIAVDGGAINIETSGKATLTNTIIARNSTNGKGGGIANQGTLNINDSVVLVNFSVGSGGGIYNSENGTLTINRSTVAFNSTSNTINENTILGGGGIFNDVGGNLTIVNSTISGNNSIIGGGIWTQGDQATIINSTIVNNSGSTGAGILSGNPQDISVVTSTILRNNIVAENINSTDIAGTFNEQSSYNLIGTADRGTLVNGFSNNLVGTTESPINPLIGDLPQEFTTTDDASTKLVHPLLPGSPAINAGNNANSQIRDLLNYYGNEDQQQQARIVNGIVDIGSYEYSESSGINDDNSSTLDTPVYRFQNEIVKGTYLFATVGEAQNIRNNYPTFKEEGFAFEVGLNPADDLIALYRFQNQNVPGTYLYANAQERQTILQNFSNFEEEGIAFYAYGADENKGQDIYRLQNIDQPGTYLFVGETEKNNILANFSNFRLEGTAFEVA